MRVAFVDLVSVDNYTIQKKMEWDAMLLDLSNKIAALVDLESFQGEAANCAKSYMYEMHSFLITQMKMYNQELMSKLTVYVSEYLTLDTSVVAVLDTFTMSVCATNMESYSGYIESDEKAMKTAVANIADLYTAPPTSYTTVMDDFETIGDGASLRAETMLEFDRSEVDGPVKILEDYDMDIYRLIAEASEGNAVSPGSYKSGDIRGFKSYEASYNSLKRSAADLSLETDRIKDAFNAVADANEELQDMQALEEKKKKSVLHIVKGTGCIIAGVAVIVATDGAATPVVIGAMVLSTGCMTFGASEYYEAGDEIYNIIQNDPDAVAVNPIRDTVFAGDQEAYDTAMSVTTTVAGLYGGGVQAAQSAVEQGIEDVTGYVIVSGAESLAQGEIRDAVFQGSVDAFEEITGIELDDVTEEIITGTMGVTWDGADVVTGGFVPTIYN